MDLVFYRTIRPAEGQTIGAVVRRASLLGYQLVAFEGYDDSDLGVPGNRGPYWEDSRRNFARILEIQDACVVHWPDGDDWPQIDHTAIGRNI